MHRTLRGVPKQLRYRCLQAGLVTCLSIAPDAALAPGQGPEVTVERLSGRTVEATLEAGRLTLQAEGAPLAEVLRAIGAVGAFDVVLRGDLSEPIHQSFTDEPLEDAIRKLVRAHSLIVIRNHPTQQALTRLAEIRVTANRTQLSSEAAGTELSPSAPDIVPEGDEIDRAAREEAYRQAVFDYIPPTRDDLLFELEEPDAAARLATVPKVGSLSPAEAIDVISHVFSNDDDSTVRSRAVAALTRLDGPGARGLLRARALGDADPGLRIQALNALASSRGERALNVIGLALRQDPAPRVRIAAIRALGRVGGDWARHYLERATRDLDREIANAARLALDTALERRE